MYKKKIKTKKLLFRTVFVELFLVDVLKKNSRLYHSSEQRYSQNKPRFSNIQCTGCPKIQSTKKKIKYFGHVLTKLNNLLLNERETFKVLFDTKSFYTYCSKVSPFTSRQNFSLFSNTIKNILQCLFIL